MNLANEFGLYVIEDNAQAIGSKYTFSEGRVKSTGTIGHIGTTSFFPSKNLGCYGDGGAMFTNDDNIAKNLKMIANHGQEIKYHHKVTGCNSRLDSIQAAILNIKLNFLDSYTSNRKIMANKYNIAFNEIDEIKTPKVILNSDHVYHQYTIRVLNGRRDDLKGYLNDLGIPSMIYYPIPIHKQKPYFSGQSLSNTDVLSNQAISLPIHTELENANQEYIIDKLIKYFK